MKEFFKNFNLQKLSLLITALAFIAILFIMGVKCRYNAITPILDGDSEGIIALKDKIDKNYKEELYRKYDYVGICGLSAKAFGMTELNGILKLQSGSLMENPAAVADYPSSCAENLKKLDDYVKERDKELLYIQIPTKGGENSGLLPKGKADCGDALYDALESDIKKYGIDTLSMRAVFEQAGLTQKDVYFDTDHHWNIRTAFFAFSEMVKFFNENYGLNIDAKYTDINNYDVEVYEDIFLGSHGKKVGRYYAGMDDFELIVPQKELDSEITFEVPSKNLLRQGSFRQSVMDERHMVYDMQNPPNCYEAYLGGSYRFAKITNENAPVNKKLLMLTDSMGYPVISFMSLVFKEIEYVDLRYYRESSFIDVFEEFDPDIVVLNYYMTRLFDGVAFDFFEKIEKDQVIQ